mmetsp:Transcript_113028/g.319798  ORF Transcript_113028/g.319798 Transcript_113028/m.319798 type:complete len:220 (+) Transcript_113028:308-967(+)
MRRRRCRPGPRACEVHDGATNSAAGTRRWIDGRAPGGVAVHCTAKLAPDALPWLRDRHVHMARLGIADHGVRRLFDARQHVQLSEIVLAVPPRRLVGARHRWRGLVAAFPPDHAPCQRASHLLQPLFSDANWFRHGEAVWKKKILHALLVLWLPWELALCRHGPHEVGGGRLDEWLRAAWRLGGGGAAYVGDVRWVKAARVPLVRIYAPQLRDDVAVIA